MSIGQVVFHKETKQRLVVLAIHPKNEGELTVQDENGYQLWVLPSVVETLDNE